MALVLRGLKAKTFGLGTYSLDLGLEGPGLDFGLGLGLEGPGLDLGLGLEGSGLGLGLEGPGLGLGLGLESCNDNFYHHSQTEIS